MIFLFWKLIFKHIRKIRVFFSVDFIPLFKGCQSVIIFLKMAKNLLLVENDPVSQERIKAVITKYCPDWEVYGPVTSAEELHNSLLNPSSFDLIVSCIQLSDKPCFGVFEQLQLKIPTIFLAESDEHAFRAFDFPCVDYLLKPFTDKRLVRAFEKFESFSSTAYSRSSRVDSSGKFFENKPFKGYKKRFLTKSGSRLSFVPVDNVAYFIAEEGITFLVESGSSQKFIVYHSLNELQSGLLDPDKFYRINRSMIINLDNLIEMKPYHNGRLILSLNAKTEEIIVVARERVNEFKSWINQ